MQKGIIMKKLVPVLSVLLCIISPVLAQDVASKPGAKITGGIYLGWPAGVNLSAGIDTDKYGVNLSGMYYGKDESERFICNGIFLDLYKTIGKYHAGKHRLSIVFGYSDFVNDSNDSNENTLYLGPGYAFHWKSLFIQGGVVTTLLTPNYKTDSLNDFYIFSNIGLLFNLGSL
jgi:hypothetical protein